MIDEPERPVNCLSDLILDRWRAQGRPSGPSSMHLQSCERCEERLAQLDALERVFVEVAPPFAQLCLEPAPQPRASKRPPWFWAVPAAVGVVGLALLILARDNGTEVDHVRLKGVATVAYYHQGGHGSVLVTGSADRRHGDTIRFAYSTSEAAHLVIVGLEESGKSSVYFDDGGVAAPVAPGSMVLLPESVILDESLGVERVYGFFCEKPEATNKVVQVIHRDESVELAGCTVSVLEWRKVAR